MFTLDPNDLKHINSKKSHHHDHNSHNSHNSHKKSKHHKDHHHRDKGHDEKGNLHFGLFQHHQSNGGTTSTNSLLDKVITVQPDYAYPNNRLTKAQLAEETDKPSEVFHDLRVPSRKGEEIGLFQLEILQAFGLPKLDQFGETDAYCFAVCGAYAFRTDVIPDIPHPRWLCKMRRACIFPIFEAYARVYVGLFDDDGEGDRDDFAGRIVLDIARFRPNSIYDVTLPMRESAQVYSRQPRGCIRVRFKLQWHNEREMVLSYIPKEMPKADPKPKVTVRCCDKKSFQNIAMTVHGYHMPGRFSTKVIKALIREITFTETHIVRYIFRREIQNLTTWQYPVISGFVFAAWMQSVYTKTFAYIPGHLLTYLLMLLWKNYPRFAMEGPMQRGFVPPSWAEMVASLLFGGNHAANYDPIAPLDLTPPKQRTPLEIINGNTMINAKSNQSISSRSFGSDRNSRKGELDLDLDMVADDFCMGVRARQRRTGLTFTGAHAVDFLVDSGYATSRVEAVELGRLLATKYDLFEHVNKEHQLLDQNLHYRFLHYDRADYVSRTRAPLGKALFELLGVMPSHHSRKQDQMDLPYGPGKDYPRFTIREGLVLRSKESKLRVEKIMADDADDAEALGVDFGGRPIPHDEDDTDTHSVGSNLTGLSSEHASLHASLTKNDPNLIVKKLKPPAQQDMDRKSKSDKKPLPVVTNSMREAIHKLLGHSFNFRTYYMDHDLSGDGATSGPAKKRKAAFYFRLFSNVRHAGKHHGSTGTGTTAEKASNDSAGGGEEATTSATGSRPLRALSHHSSHDGDADADREGGSSSRRHHRPGRLFGRKKKKHEDGDEALDGPPEFNTDALAETANEEYDRLLKTGPYSSNNPWVARIGVIVQPIIEAVGGFVSLLRAIYNIFTWRDPILTTWVTLICPVLIVLLHAFPWRLVSFICGIVFVGPQNWILRIRRERKGIPPRDLDVVVKKRKKEKPAPEPKEEPLFWCRARDNEPLDYKSLENEEIRHVVVPHSPYMFNHRFYDWPPEPEYCKVTVDRAQIGAPDKVVGSRISAQTDRPTGNGFTPQRPTEENGGFLLGGIGAHREHAKRE